MNADAVLRLLNLAPLPGEGGYFRRTFTSRHCTDANRPFGTAIHYLVTPEEFSALHVLMPDELFHFYLGDPVEMVQIDEQGNLTRIVMGHQLDRGQVVQHLVPGGIWQGTRLVAGGQWALLGCTVVPGFEYSDSLLGDRDALTKKFPKHADVIRRYTRVADA